MLKSATLFDAIDEKETHQLRSRPLIDMSSGIPFLVPGTVLVYGTLEVMDREKQLLSAPLVQRAKDTVMANQSLEFTAEGMSLDPVWISN